MVDEIMNYTISPEQANSECYLNTLRQEIETARRFDIEALRSNRSNQLEILEYKSKILGGKGSSMGFSDWMDFLIDEYSPRSRCLSLGSGIGRVEKYLVSNGFTDKMETIELCADENEGIRIHDPKVNTVSGDLNFITLPENIYDFILCHGVLHHLINLEHVLYQINKALTPEGIFLAYEYVGENRWQFDEERITFLKTNLPSIKFKQRPAWSVGGFESVRSGDLLSLILAQFGDACERSVSYGGVYFPFIITTTRKSDFMIPKVISLDKQAVSDGSLDPCYHMGLYRKSERKPSIAQPWSDEEVAARLCPKKPIWRYSIELLGKTPVGPFLRAVKSALPQPGVAGTKKV